MRTDIPFFPEFKPFGWFFYEATLGPQSYQIPKRQYIESLDGAITQFFVVRRRLGAFQTAIEAVQSLPEGA